MGMVNLCVYCDNCGEEIQKEVYAVDNDVEVSMFAQSDWHCSNCGHTSIIGDIDVIDKELLFGKEE